MQCKSQIPCSEQLNWLMGYHYLKKMIRSGEHKVLDHIELKRMEGYKVRTLEFVPYPCKHRNFIFDLG
jgi:hypothetical protein